MDEKSSPYSDPRMARCYAETAGPLQFAEPAKDLVSFLQPLTSNAFLDVGSGSGLIAEAATNAIGKSGSVVALDRSMEMLRQQRNRRVCRIAGSAQHLPFLENTFDRIAAGFVISHLPDYRKGIREWLRVLRPGGLLAATSWEAGTTIPSEIWKRTLKDFSVDTIVEEEFLEIIPSDQFFSDRDNLVAVFIEAGFVEINQRTNRYLLSMDAGHYVDLKTGSVEGTIVRRNLQPAKWDHFAAMLKARLQEQFPDRIEYARNVHFVLGQKPDRSPR